jgi:hypothetical protein
MVNQALTDGNKEAQKALEKIELTKIEKPTELEKMLLP